MPETETYPLSIFLRQGVLFSLRILGDALVYTSRILGAFANLRKADLCFIMSVCLSVRTEQRGFPWTDFHEV